LSLVLAILCLGLLDLLIVFFEHFVGEVEFIVYWIFSLVVFEVFAAQLLNDGLRLCFRFKGNLLLGLLVFVTLSYVGKSRIAFLNKAEHLGRIGFFGEIRMVDFDKFEVGCLQLLFGEVDRDVEEFIVIDCFSCKPGKQLSTEHCPKIILKSIKCAFFSFYRSLLVA
jgi:hypothetical protein